MPRKKESTGRTKITETYGLMRLRTVWGWGEAEEWEDVQACCVEDYLGSFDSVSDVIAEIERLDEDGLYKWFRLEQAISPKGELACVEWFEHRLV